MRGLLTILLILFITNLCFAIEHEHTRHAFHPVKENKIILMASFFHKVRPQSSNINEDRFEQPTYIQQLLKKQEIASVQLFQRTDNKLLQYYAAAVYIADARSNYKFIYHFLFPKHVFW